MSLTKAFLELDSNIKATVVADSITVDGHRITTIEAEYPRFILAEVNTHSAIEKNSSSSRAIPIFKMIEQIEANMATPLYWGLTQAGMQAGDELSGDSLLMAKSYWRSASRRAIRHASNLHGIGLHKQTANRLLEPFQMMKTVMTATDWDNFFNLRIHPDAQPEFCLLAYKIYKAIQASKPALLRAGEWHLPYVEIVQGLHVKDTYYHVWNVDNTGTETDGYKYEQPLTLEQAQKISASCCAQTSYRKSDTSFNKASKIFDMLVYADVLHASPFGHLATPVEKTKRVYDFTEAYKLKECVNMPEAPSTWQKGITHMTREGVFGSGNLRGWVSYRHLLQDNTCWKFDFEERMKLFA